MRQYALLIIFLAFILGFTAGAAAQDFTRVDAGFPLAHDPANVLVDLDNDGDLDVFVAGLDEEGIPLAEIYLNNGGSFSLVTSLPGVNMASCAAADFNNDGLVDLVLCGMGTSSPVTKIYRNEGGVNFTDISAGITGLSGGGIAWGDYDNDGRADLLICGENASGEAVTIVYHNDGSEGFSDAGFSFTGLKGGGVAWCDIDRDQDLDLVVTGENASGNPETVIYTNNGDTFDALGAGIPGLAASSASWGDYNNDTYPDLLLTGADEENTSHTIIYENLDGSNFNAVEAELEGVAFGTGIWGDFDNDGKLDLVVAGQEVEAGGGGGPPVPVEPARLLLYLNLGNDQFQKHILTPGGVVNNALSCGDYDNDSDLDILISGMFINPIGVMEGNTALFRNETSITNNPPVPPAGLSADLAGVDISLSWDATTDDKTPPEGLNYNIRIGTQENNMDIYPAMADPDNGLRRVAAIGNVCSNTSWNAKDLPFGEVYISVQAIDPSYAGSGFSEFVVLEIIPTADFIAEDSVCVLAETTITYVGNASEQAQYNWDFDGAIIVTGSGQGPYTLYWETEGLKNLSLTVTEDGVSSEVYSLNVMVIAYPGTPGFIAGSTELCQGAPASEYYVPAVTGAIEYEWGINPPEAGNITGNHTTGTVQWDPSFHGNAYVFVRGLNFCGYGPWSDSLDVLVDPLPEKPGLPYGPAALCLGSPNTTYSINAVAYANGYHWYLIPEAAGNIFPNGLQAEVDWSAGYTGEASIVVAAFNSCGEGPASDSLSIQIETPPVVNAGVDQSIPYGSATQLSGSASGGSGDYSYSWSPENLVTDPGSPATNTVALEQSVQFILHVDDNISGCSKTDAVVVTVTGGPLSVDALADPNHICSGEEVNLLALVSGGSGSYVYSWTSDPPGFTADSANPAAYPEETTMYFTEVTDGIESARDSALVLVETVPDVPGEITGPMTVCAGDQDILYEIDPMPGATHYLWTLGNGMFGSSDSTSILVSWDDNFSGTGGSIGVWSVNECGISDEGSWIAPEVKKIPDVPQAIIGPDSLCITTDSIVVYRLDESAQWADDYEWQVIPADAGYLVPDGMEASMHWAPGWEGEVLILARAVNICFQSEWSDPLAVWAFNCLGIRDSDREGVKLFIYPNPADEILGVRCYVSGDHVNLDLFIFDLFGRKVLETFYPGRGLVEINTSGIPAGLYILSLRGENGLMVSTRIVIQH